MARQTGGSQTRGTARGNESSAGARNASARNASSSGSTGSSTRSGSTGSSTRSTGAAPKQTGSAAKQTGSTNPSNAQRAAADQRSDQERKLDVSRENATSMDANTASSGTSAAPTSQSRTQRESGSSVANRSSGESSIMPALMSNPWLMTNAFLSNPFGFARAMTQEMDRMFYGTPGDIGSSAQRAVGGGPESRSVDASRPQRSGMSQWAPQVEVRQNGNQLTVCADLPGMEAKDIDIQVEDGILTVSGHRHQSSEENQEGYYRSERNYGSFSRSIALPDGVNEDQIRAKFDKGVLEVTVPVPQQRQRGRRVEIQSGG